LKDFISIAETEVKTVLSLYSVVVISQPLTFDNVFDPEMIFCFSFSYDCQQGKNAVALVNYFGEDPKWCPFEQGMAEEYKFHRSSCAIT